MAEEPREPVYLVAKYEYTASSEQELSLRKNERLRLLDDSKQWWKVWTSIVNFSPTKIIKNIVNYEKNISAGILAILEIKKSCIGMSASFFYFLVKFGHSTNQSVQ